MYYPEDKRNPDFPIIIDNFWLQPSLLAALKGMGASHSFQQNGFVHLLPTSAFKPMHRLFLLPGFELENPDFNDGNGQLANVRIFVRYRKVFRGPQLITRCHSSNMSDNERLVLDPEGEADDAGLYRVPFLNIQLSKPYQLREDPEKEAWKYPRLFYTRQYFGKTGESVRGTIFPLDPATPITKLVTIVSASASRTRYKVTLWSHSARMANHPWFNVAPDRMGHIDIKWPVEEEAA